MDNERTTQGVMNQLRKRSCSLREIAHFPCRFA